MKNIALHSSNAHPRGRALSYLLCHVSNVCWFVGSKFSKSIYVFGILDRDTCRSYTAAAHQLFFRLRAPQNIVSSLTSGVGYPPVTFILKCYFKSKNVSRRITYMLYHCISSAPSTFLNIDSHEYKNNEFYHKSANLQNQYHFTENQIFKITKKWNPAKYF